MQVQQFSHDKVNYVLQNIFMKLGGRLYVR